MYIFFIVHLAYIVYGMKYWLFATTNNNKKTANIYIYTNTVLYTRNVRSRIFIYFIFWKIIYVIHFLLPFPFKWTHMMIYFYGFLILYSFNSMIFGILFSLGRYYVCFLSADMLKEVKYLAVYHSCICYILYYIFSSVLISITHAYKNILYDALVCYYTIDLLFFLYVDTYKYVWHNIIWDTF